MVNKNGGSSTSEPMAVIAASGRYPKAENLDALWKNLLAGVDGISEAKGDRWDLGYHVKDSDQPNRVYTKCGGFIDRVAEFDAEFFGMSPREAAQVDPQHRLLLELTWEAFESAGIRPSSLAGSNTGVFVGISNNDYSSLSSQNVNAYTNIGSALSIAANRISYIFDFHGPSFSVDTACSSSMVAMHQACLALAGRECDMAVVGGVNLLLCIRPWIGFAEASMLSPDGRCKSFDADGKGYVRAEGGGIVLVKRLADAERDGDEILGVIVATGVNSDGRTMGMALPSKEAQEQLLRTVYGRAGVTAEDVFYVEAHGTGTSVGDPIECEAIGRVLGAPRTDGTNCLIGSVKSNVGHLESGAGITGLIKLLLALKHRIIPANLHFKTPNPKIDFTNWKLAVVDKATPLPDRDKPLLFGINSFGFGGTNGHLVLREYRKTAAATAETPATHEPAEDWSDLFLISARSPAALDQLAASYADVLEQSTPDAWQNLRASAALCRDTHTHRLALTGPDAKSVATDLREYLAGKPTPRLAKGRYGEKSRKLALVFSGNGPQWWGMGRELFAESALFKAEIEKIDAIFAPLAGWSIIDEMQKAEADVRIGLTEVAQPLLFAQQVAITEILKKAGITADAVFGHSVGEAAAAYASGALSLEQATKVIYHRSQMQARTAGRGKMAAVGIGPEQAAKEIAEINGWLEIAAYNSPRAVTIAGAPDALETLRDRLTSQGHFIRILALDYPFHTSAMDDIETPLKERLASLAPAAATIPFISTVEGKVVAGTELDADYWWRNIRAPVQFERAVANAINEHGITLFLEVGPHPVLKDYLVQTAKSIENVQATALNTLRRPAQGRPAPELQTLKSAIASVYASGGGKPEAIFTRPAKPESLPFYAWQRARYWRGAVELPDAFIPAHREHPLLGSRTPSTNGLWTNTIQTTLVPYLKDHVVQDAVVFPGAGYLELALAAAGSSVTKGAVDIENFEVARPFVIAPNAEPIVQLALDAEDGTFFIRTRPSLEVADWTEHTKGRISKADTADLEASLDLTSLGAEMPVKITGAAHYAECNRRGLFYGPAFQGLQEIALTAPRAAERAALARISLELTEQDLAGYRMHPALFDSCIQALISLIAQNDTRACATLPIRIERLRSLAPMPANVMCHVTLRRESLRSGIADFTITDLDGRIIAIAEGARFQKVEFRSTELPLLAEDWRPDPAWIASRAQPLALPAPRDNAAQYTALAEAIFAEEGRAAFAADIAPRIEALAGSYAASTLAELGAAEAPFTIAALARKAEVASDQIPLLTRLVAMAEKDGVLIKTGNAWRWKADAEPATPATLWRALMLDYPNYAAELMALARAATALVLRLRGEEGGDTSVAMLPTIEDTAPYRAAYNRLAAETLRDVVAKWPAGKAIRIVEFAGSTGGLAASLLPVLPPERTDYLFTDPNDQAVSRAKTRFSDHHFFRASLPAAADAETAFDIAVAAIAAGSEDDLAARLAEISAKLATGGIALLLVRRASRFSDIVFGSDTRGLSIADDALAGLLQDAGFEGEVVMSDAGHPAHTVVIARHAKAQAALPAPQASAGTRRTLVVTEEDAGTPFVAALSAALAARGDIAQIRTISPGDLNDDAMSTLVAEEAASTEFVHLAGWAASPATAADVMPIAELRCLSAILLARAMENQAVKSETPFAATLTLVTRGAFAGPSGAGPIDPLQAPLAGVGRVIANEQGSLGCRAIDVHATQDDTAAAETLADALLARDKETEVLLADGRRYVNRVRETSLAEQSRISNGRNTKCDAAAAAYKLDFRAQGGLDSLHLVEIERKAPQAGEIEIAIKAAGLNFRDVLYAMGMLPEEAVELGFSGPTIGMECAGEVVRVGEGVTAFKPGDRVIAFASSCFASHVTTLASTAARMPEGLSFTEAATIPTTFVTAWYALEYLARMEAGETVLIHGAAGGVGLAAIQIAKARGAIVIGTAGSADKQRLVKTMGADYVLSSRSLKFADDIMSITGGKGVDIVLNSLAGEAITKGLQVLKPFGRFLEIGKRDLYANSRIGLRPFRQNLSYFGIDADTLLVERAALAKRMFDEVVAALATRTLRPLPHAATPISRASEAFRAMQQSRHVGKLVVTMEDAAGAALPVVAAKPRGIRPGVTYLVTGGLGGFGLATAHWLADQGATSLALASRRGDATDEAKAGIRALVEKGVNVRAFATDIANPAAVDAMLAEIRSSMAPLKGIIHSAAVIEDAPLMKVDSGLLSRVFGAKAVGAYNLHTATLADDLELFVLYSSSSAVVGNPGQGTYVAANIYLDALAEQRRAMGLPALSIGWGAIKDAGFLTRNAAVEEMLAHRAGMESTPVAEALAELGRLIACGATRVAAARFNLMRLGQSLAGARTPRFTKIVPEGMGAAADGAGSIASALEALGPDERRALLLTRVRQHIGRVIGLDAEQVEPEKSLTEFGIDSLMAVELAEALEQDIGKPLSVMQMIQAGTVTGVMETALRSFGGAAANDKAPAPAAAAPPLEKAA